MTYDAAFASPTLIERGVARERITEPLHHASNYP